MAALLRDVQILEYDVLAIQEPWICSFADTTHFPRECKDHYDLIWLSIIRPAVPRVRTYIRKDLKYTPIYWDQHALTVSIETEYNIKIFVHNIYNPPQFRANPGVTSLRAALSTADTIPGKNNI
ncbi:uncharacterized protein BDW43DRAFT_295537 [Aspergillus alliaceus]|uniref:uncharacterized protein n=1 Tax=Petromyces alliaceus TaxID=209559 RepID=UPI0012A4BB41|nr:uncharacterized protein BDW43DRAFT_295537 [Aspergillus alliaceus]KAB8226858.1 hypothetical protein BDW43DRAFT_295537 [Aspergillus alliaceus]